MPKTKKTLLPLDLAGYDVYIEDTTDPSEYFRVTNLPSVFTGGRNSFLLGGSTYLENGSEIQLEIIDAAGNTIYQSLVNNYVEGNSKMISVEIYDDVAPGFATIIVMGKAIQTTTGQQFPTEWNGVYNVRWSKRIVVDYDLKNTSPLRFLNQPEVLVEEKRFYNLLSASYDTIQIPFTASLTPLLFSATQVGYSIAAETPTTFSADLTDGKITGSITINGNRRTIDLPLTSILNSTRAFSKGHLISSSINNGKIKQIYLTSGSYTASFDSVTYNVTSSALIEYATISTSSVNIPISYASLRVSNLNTVSGELYKFRVYNKIATNTADYKLIGDIYVTTEEIFVSSSIRGNVPIGDIFLAKNYQNNWYADELVVNTGLRNQLYTVSGSAAYYDPSVSATPFLSSSDSVLLSSIYATVPIDLSTNKFSNQVSQSGYFIGTTNSYTLFPTSEYTLTMDAYYKKTSGSITLVGNTPKVDIYLVGMDGTKIVDNNPLGQKIGELTVSGDVQWYQARQFNFYPAIGTSGKIGLRFVVSNGFWNFSNISVKPASDTQFSPDEALILLPNSEGHNELLQYKIEFFDINNNSANVSAITIPTFFTGSAIDLGTLP